VIRLPSKLTENPIIIDIGCGKSKKEDAIGIDIRRLDIDIIADAKKIPIKSNTIDHVFSSHLIEHFSHKDVRKVLTEWMRVLKKEGILEIRCPDLRARAFLFFLNPTLKDVRNIYGGQDYMDNYHKCGFSYGLLKRLLESCGVRNVKRIIKGYKGIPFLPDCLHVRGVKR